MCVGLAYAHLSSGGRQKILVPISAMGHCFILPVGFISGNTSFGTTTSILFFFISKEILSMNM